MSDVPVESVRDRFGAKQTLKFVQAVLPINGEQAQSILDAGCGDGTLAKYLCNAGYTVTAIDRSSKMIELARSAGVAAKNFDFLEYEAPFQFDAVLFSRSLHHILPLESAVEKVKLLLKPDGLLLVEDFAVERMRLDAAIWFYGLKSLLHAFSPLKGHGPALEDGRIPADPMRNWFDHHVGKHSVTEFGAIVASVEAKFELVNLQSVPYLYRYFEDDVSSSQGDAIFQWESEFCDRAVFEPMGRRMVARLRTF